MKKMRRLGLRRLFRGGASTAATATANEAAVTSAAVDDAAIAATVGAKAKAAYISEITCALPCEELQPRQGYALSCNGDPDVNFGVPPPPPPASKLFRSVPLWYVPPLLSFYVIFHHACVLLFALLLHYDVITFRQIKNKYIGLGLLRFVIDDPAPKDVSSGDAGWLERHCSPEFAGHWDFVARIAAPWFEFECVGALLTFPFAWRCVRRLQSRPA